MTAQQTIIQQLTLPIRGMTCMGCAANVQLALSDLPGVHDVIVDLPAKQALIIYDSTLVEEAQIAAAVTEAGYEVDRNIVPHDGQLSGQDQTQHPWLKPILFGFLGVAGLLVLYLGLVSLAEGWQHAVDLLIEDAWLVSPIVAGFGIQIGLYTYLRTVVRAAAQGTGALAGAGGGTSTVAMAACCAHHVTDVLPLLGLSMAAAFLAEYRIPFMLVGLATNLIGIGIIGFLIWRAKKHRAECDLYTQPAAPASVCH